MAIRGRAAPAKYVVDDGVDGAYDFEIRCDLLLARGAHPTEVIGEEGDFLITCGTFETLVFTHGNLLLLQLRKPSHLERLSKTRIEVLV
jgi:hypothetical protein